MGRFDSTKTAIDVNITQNGNQEITGSILNSVLNNMVDATDAQLEILQEAIPIKLSDLEQDIPIGSYDDTELRERIEENEVLIEDLQNTKIDKEADDYYPQLAVGLADNLSGVDVVDSEVNFRRSGGGAISDGVARIEAIKGNSVVWNQVYPTGWSFTREGITSTSQNNIITANGTLTTTYFDNSQFVGNEVNHKYLFIVEGLSSALNGANFSLQNRPGNEAIISNGFAYFFHDNSDPSLGRNIGFSRLTSGTVISETYILRQIDLTKAFPNDWQNINTIEEFYARIPMGVDLNAYNEGEVIHMDVQSIESQGVNAWDEEWELGQFDSTSEQWILGTNYLKSKNLIPILPNTQYRVTNPPGTISRYVYYDCNKQYLSWVSATSNSVFQTPSSACYMHFQMGSGYGTTYNNDICINLYDTSINGKYFPYIKRVEDLSIIRKYFPQGMKKAGTAHDEIRFNKASGKWEYSKGKMKEVDMGTLTWNRVNEADGRFRYNVKLPSMKTFPSTEIANVLVSLFPTVTGWDVFDNTKEGVAVMNLSYLSIYDKRYEGLTPSEFKAAMQGVILYYESNDWEWEELDAEDQFKDLDYQVWNCGTEKAIAEGKSAPLAADITYGFNAIGKIKELESLVAALRAKVGI